MERLAKQIPRHGGDPYATGSLLRPFRKAKERAGPAIAPLAKVFPVLLERAKASLRVELQAVVDQALAIFAAVPDQWAASRGAVEYALQAQWKSAEECKKILLQAMPIPWDRGLIVPKRPSPQTPAPFTPRAAYRAGPEPVTVKSSPWRNLAGALLLVPLLFMLCFSLDHEVSRASQSKPRSKPSRKPAAAAPVKARGYQLGLATVTTRERGSVFKIEGEPVEEVEDEWSRYRTSDGQVILSRHSGRSRGHTFAQSDVLMLDGKAILKAGQPMADWKAHKKAAEEAGIQVQREVGKSKTSILGFSQALGETEPDWAPHTSVSAGAMSFFNLIRSRSSRQAEWKASLVNASEWKRLRLSDGTPLVHRLLGTPAGFDSVAAEYTAEKARFLIENGYDLSLTDNEGRSALHRSLDPALTKLLLKKGLSVDLRDRFGRTPLFEASGARLEVLLAAKANPNGADSEGRTPLMLAPDAEAVYALLEAGAQVNAKDSSGRTALFYQNALESLVLLLANGADTEIRDSQDKTAEGFKKGRDLKTYLLARSKA